MTKTLCLAAALALSATLVSAQTASPTPAPSPAPVATPAVTPDATPAAMADATAKPDLSGTWTLNLGKSTFDPVPAPDDETIIFSKTGSTWTIATTSNNERGKEVFALPFTIDGAETPTPTGVFADTASLQYLSTKSEWAGSSLVLTQKIMYRNDPGGLESTFTLSPDGKTLTRAMHISVDQGEFDTISVFDKQ